MDEVAVLKALMESDGVIGVVVSVMILIGGLYIRHQMMAKASPTSKDDGKGATAEWRAATDKRLAALETAFEHMPTREELHAVDKSVVAIEERVRGIETTTQSTNHAVTRIETFLLNYGGKK